MNRPAPASEMSVLPRAVGHVRLRSKQTPRGAALDRLYQKGALKAVFPRGDGLTGVMVNTAGGVTGGDRFRLEACAGTGSALTLTTQAAERAYRALPGEIGRVRTSLSGEAGAHISWLPQETILFDGASFERRLRCDLAGDATLVLVEPLILGRAAMGERCVRGRMAERIEVFRDGVLIFRDSWALEGDLSDAFARPGIGAAATAMASLLCIGPKVAAWLEPLRAHFGTEGGASLRAADMLVGRLLAKDGYHLRKRLVPALMELTGNQLPTCWRL